MIRVLISVPLIVAGEVITTIGYRVAGAAHLNPHTRVASASLADRRPS